MEARHSHKVKVVGSSPTPAPKTFNADTLQSYFQSYYRFKNGVAYQPLGKGREIVQLSKLLKVYDPYQILRAMRAYIDNAIMGTVNGFVQSIEELIEDYASDQLESKAYIVLHSQPNPKLRRAYYNYLDYSDSWFSNKAERMEARRNLENLLADFG